MQISSSRIAADFDLIAETDNSNWDNNTLFHKYLLSRLPEEIGSSLDLGCGKGIFTELLSTRSGSVTAIDISKGMIEKAKHTCRNRSNIRFVCKDIVSFETGIEQYDYIISVAALHHMKPDIIIPKLITALKINGSLLVVDLFRNEGLTDYFFSAVSLPVNFLLNIFHNGRIFRPQVAASAWNLHAASDRYLSMKELKELAGKYLPGAVTRRCLLWRYTLEWKKSNGNI